MDDYNEQAKNFLKETGTTLDIIEAVPQKKPLWVIGDEKHGINYSCTLKNTKGSYTFDFWGSISDMEKIELAKKAQGCGVYSKEYFAIKDFCEKRSKNTVPNEIAGKSLSNRTLAALWIANTIETVKILITPSAYGVLSCIGLLHDDNFADFCSNYGYDTDSLRALKTYEALQEQDRNLRRLFTHEQLEVLESIR